MRGLSCKSCLHRKRPHLSQERQMLHKTESMGITGCQPSGNPVLESLFVCVEVLRPSQPNGVMSSAVSLPNHTFTGQA